jgi:pimeloyl-ACP methyl ester carboxylesterase
MDGASTSQDAAQWWTESWRGQSFMAVGALDPVLGLPVMEELRHVIKGCPPPMVVEEGGHFVQEHGEGIARAALEHFARG